MHSLHIPRDTRWSLRKAALVIGASGIAFWTLVIWAVRALLQ